MIACGKQHLKVVNLLLNCNNMTIEHATKVDNVSSAKSFNSSVIMIYCGEFVCRKIVMLS